MICPCKCKYHYKIDIRNTDKRIHAVKINGKLAIDSIELVQLYLTSGIYTESKIFDRKSNFKIETLKKAEYKQITDVDTFNCIKWDLSKPDIEIIIKESAPISRNEWKQFFEHLTCMYEGKIRQNGKLFDFEMNAGGWFVIFEADTFYKFGNYKKENDNYFLRNPIARRVE